MAATAPTDAAAGNNPATAAPPPLSAGGSALPDIPYNNPDAANTLQVVQQSFGPADLPIIEFKCNFNIPSFTIQPINNLLNLLNFVNRLGGAC